MENKQDWQKFEKVCHYLFLIIETTEKFYLKLALALRKSNLQNLNTTNISEITAYMTDLQTLCFY